MSNDILPFTFENHQIRVVTDENGEPHFVAADILTVLTLDRKAMARLDDDEKGVRSIHTLGGVQEMTTVNEAGLYSLILGSRKQEAKSFKRWVTHDVLPSIRKTGEFRLEPLRSNLATLVPVSREIRAAVSIAKALGFKGNQAVLSANKAVCKITGVDVLQAFDATHLIADSQDVLLTVTEIGQRAGLSVRKVNPTLEDRGLVRGYRDAKGRQCWELTEKGERAGGTYLDTGKKHGDGTPVRQIKWNSNVIDFLKAKNRAA